MVSGEERRAFKESADGKLNKYFTRLIFLIGFFVLHLSLLI